ncbi:hypothetical protein KXX35_009384 [Aspergillus fumigatus]|nr:hypothetical protein KXX35_009384 [Aspergillus fumigatus]
MSSATSSSAQGRPATAGGAPSQGQGGHTQAGSVDRSRQPQRDGQSQSVTVPVDRRATGSALESPVIFDGRRVDGILAGLVEYENQVNALRHRLGGLVRDVQDFYFENVRGDEDGLSPQARRAMNRIRERFGLNREAHYLVERQIEFQRLLDSVVDESGYSGSRRGSSMRAE